MAQFARPIADSPAFATTWLPSPNYAEIDEAVADDGTTYIYSPSGGAGINDRTSIQLDSITDPGVDTGHVLRVKLAYQHANEFGDDLQVVVNLYQGDSFVAGSYVATLDATATGWVINGVGADSSLGYTTYTYTLLEAEAALITDYTDLWIDIGTDNGSEQTGAPWGAGAAARWMRVSQVELEVPTADTQLYSDDFESTSAITVNYSTPTGGSPAKTANAFGVGGGWGAGPDTGDPTHVGFRLLPASFLTFPVAADSSILFYFEADYDAANLGAGGFAMVELEQHHSNPLSSLTFSLVSVIFEGGGDLELDDADFVAFDTATAVVTAASYTNHLRLEGQTSTYTAGVPNSDGWANVYINDVLVMAGTGMNISSGTDPIAGGAAAKLGFAIEPQGHVDNIDFGYFTLSAASGPTLTLDTPTGGVIVAGSPSTEAYDGLILNGSVVNITGGFSVTGDSSMVTHFPVNTTHPGSQWKLHEFFIKYRREETA